jgi:predicted  nucleic acid-binding Zn-ribbon protein
VSTVGIVIAAAVAALVVAVVVTAWVARRRAARPLEARLETLIAELTGLRLSAARLEERLAAAGAEVDRLRALEVELNATLSRVEQEKARLDYELRQVGLVASRVPELEQRLADRDRLAADLELARHRVTELEPMAEELELRNQFIETLQRELAYRDERSLALERRAEHLAGVVEVLEAAGARTEVDWAAATRPGEQRGLFPTDERAAVSETVTPARG